MFIKISNFLLVAGAIQGFIFAIVPLFLKRKIAKPIWFLNGTVLFISLNNFQSWIVDKDFLTSFFFLKNLKIPWYVLTVPLFYSFLVYYLRINNKVRTYLYFTLFLFSVEVIGMVFLIHNNSTDNTLVKKYIRFIEIVNILYSFFIFTKAFLIIFKPKKSYKYILSFDKMRWLKQFIVFGICIMIFWLIGMLLNIYIENGQQKFSYYPLRLCSSTLIYWIGYQGLMRYRLTSQRISLRKELANDKAILIKQKEIIKKSKNYLYSDDDTVKKTITAIENYILENQLFTDPLLCLNSVSVELNITKNLLSKSINSCCGCNFSDYINKFRVELSKEMLVDKKYDEYTINSIGLECGFNSKSTFYASFKKFVGITPMQFRNQNS